MAQAAERALIDRPFVTAIDVLVGIGWLTTSQVDRWRQGRVDHLERQVTANPSKVSIAVAAVRHWARQQGLSRSDSPVAITGSPTIALLTEGFPKSKPPREPIGSRAPDLIVISSLKGMISTQCADMGDLLFMEGDGPHCLVCADLDRLNTTEKRSGSLPPATPWIQ